MPSILISGASRGLGLEFTRQYALDGWRVHATCRDPARADRLHALAHPNVSIHQLDAASDESVAALAQEFQGVPLDIVLANAGVAEAREITPETIKREDWLELVATNTFGPLALVGALKENLRAGEQKKAVAVSSLMASIGRNDWGTQYVYRASKSGLNALWKNLSVEWHKDGISCVLIRPGYVKTEMTGFKGDVLPEDTVAGMRRVLSGVTIADTGRYLSYDTTELPW
jgi:NAD(P)-dependent dehydrogenase (short-subunit alcohol dehydrogenase family)